MSLASEHLDASRARLRLAMLPPAPDPAARKRGWADTLHGLPVVSVVIDSVKAWWAQHPLRPTASIAAEATKAAIGPVARLHPIALVSASAVAGALLFKTRPWRWLLRSAIFAGLVPQMISRALSNMSLDS